MDTSVYVYDTVEREYAFACPSRQLADSMAEYANREDGAPGRYVVEAQR